MVCLNVRIKMTTEYFTICQWNHTGYFFTAACENRLLFSCKEKSSKKGAVKIEENQKLYKHMERGKSHLRYQWLSAPVPCHVQSDGLVCLSLFVVILFGELPPFNMIDGAFLKYFGIPVAFTWFVSQKTFDGKKPFGFLKSCVSFFLRPKVTYAGKAIKLKNQKFNTSVTAVRSVMYVPD